MKSNRASRSRWCQARAAASASRFAATWSITATGLSRPRATRSDCRRWRKRWGIDSTRCCSTLPTRLRSVRGGRRLFEQGSADQWCDIIETNVQGMIRLTHALIDGMLARGCGHIVNMGSIAGLKPYASGTAYVSSKYAVHGFSETLRLDYAGRGIRVTEIMPGLVRSGFAEQRLGDARQAQEFYDSFEQCLDPEDVARTVLFALQQPAHVEIAQLVVLPVSG